MSTTISESKNDNLNISNTIFYPRPDSTSIDSRNQLARTKSQTNNYRFGVGYTEPLSDSITVSLNVNYSSANNRNIRNVNDFDNNTGQYSDYNMLLSNSMNQKINQISPDLTFEINKKAKHMGICRT